jgi:hypothetical protein
MLNSSSAVNKERNYPRNYDTTQLPKTDWRCCDILSLVLEAVDNRIEKKEPDLEESQLGNIVWTEQQDFAEYEPLVETQAGLYSVVIGSFLRSFSRLRTTLYEYKSADIHKQIFTVGSIQRVQACVDFESLRSAILALVTEDQV